MFLVGLRTSPTVSSSKLDETRKKLSQLMVEFGKAKAAEPVAGQILKTPHATELESLR